MIFEILFVDFVLKQKKIRIWLEMSLVKILIGRFFFFKFVRKFQLFSRCRSGGNFKIIKK